MTQDRPVGRTGPRERPGPRELDELEGERTERYVGERDLTSWTTPVGRVLVRAARAVWHAAGRTFGWAAPRWVLLLTVVVGLGLASAAGATAGEINEAVSQGDGIASLDRPLLDDVLAARTPALTRAVQLYTEVGGPQGMPLLALAAVVAMSVAWRSRTPAVLVLVTAAGSLLMTVVGKAAVGRTRPALAEAVPPFESSYSFPSGHSLNAMAISGVVAYLLVLHLHRRWSRALTVVVAGAFAVTMGLSRVYLGHHWLSDVVVAWVLAVGWLAVVVTGHRLWLTLRTHDPEPAAPDRARA